MGFSRSQKASRPALRQVPARHFRRRVACSALSSTPRHVVARAAPPYRGSEPLRRPHHHREAARSHVLHCNRYSVRRAHSAAQGSVGRGRLGRGGAAQPAREEEGARTAGCGRRLRRRCAIAGRKIDLPVQEDDGEVSVAPRADFRACALGFCKDGQGKGKQETENPLFSWRMMLLLLLACRR